MPFELAFQLPFALSTLIACAVFLLAGSVALRGLHPRPLLDLPFTSIALGQMAVWFAAYAVLPLNAGLDRLVGHSPPIGFWLFGGVALSLFLTRAFAGGAAGAARGAAGASDSLDRTGWLLSAIGVAAIVKVALAYSSGSHLGALGLDTHQHIYWTRQILDAHHIPLVERDTSILALYPKGFHLLTALWSAAGIAGPIGPWVKLMPFLQAWLPCMAFAELLRLQAGKNGAANAPKAVLSLALACALAVYGFAISRMAYPEYDLNGTPRFASGLAFVFPLLALVAGRVLESARASALAWLCLPAVALLLLALNAILLVQLVVFALPLLWIASRVWPAPVRESSPAKCGLWLAASCGVALSIGLQDPWIVAQWSPRFAPGYLALLDVITPDQAATLGLMSKDELVSAPTSALLYVTIGDFGRLFFASLANGARDALTASWRFPFAADLFSDGARVVLRLVMLASVVAAAFGPHRRSANARAFRRLWLGLALGAAFSGFAQFAAAHFAEGLAVGRGYEFVLLRDYSVMAAKHTGLVLQGLILLAGIAWGLAGWAPWRGFEVRFARPAAGVAACVVLAALPWGLYGVSETVDPDRGFWAPLEAANVADLRAIEDRIGASEGVLVPAAPWGIGDERWIIPQGPTASVLPFVNRRVLFNSRLGPGVVYNWRDLARFCQGTHAERAAFLRRNDVRWFLLKDEDVETQAVQRRFRMCKLRLGDLGVVLPAEAVEGELALFRVDAARLEDRMPANPTRR